MTKKNNGKSKLVFAEKRPVETPDRKDMRSWKIIIVDDEGGVHEITKIALDGFSFEGKAVTFLSAYSGEEAKEMIRENPDVAVILLDVVMETDDSGLKIVRYIREDLKNNFTRIILRTGQPGKAPAKEVIVGYDINDYKEKSTLDNQELFTTVTASLRAYRDLRTIEKNRLGLERIIRSSSHIIENQSLVTLSAEALPQLLNILQSDKDSQAQDYSGFTASQRKNELNILSAMGEFEKYLDQRIHRTTLDGKIQQHLEKAAEGKAGLFMGDAYATYFCTQGNRQHLLYLKGCSRHTELDRDLIHIFSMNLTITFDNIYLYQENMDTQKEVILKLGELIESRSEETANHVQRVAEFSCILALEAGLSQEDAELIRFASPMHDVGKVGISDSILLKPNKLTPEEFEEMKQHTTKGYDILKKSSRKIMKTAAVIAHQHHERWDGKGYPQELKEEEISLVGRITALADVFDALSHQRHYKDAWDIGIVLDFIKKESGKHFDSRLVSILLDNVDKFVSICENYPD